MSSLFSPLLLFGLLLALLLPSSLPSVSPSPTPSSPSSSSYSSPLRPFWGPFGHAATAHIASSLLNPVALSSVTFLLTPPPSPLYSPTLESIASWADAIRNTSEYAWTFDLHFIDMPSWGTCTYNYTRDCSSPTLGWGYCVDGAIRNYTKRGVGGMGSEWGDGDCHNEPGEERFDPINCPLLPPSDYTPSPPLSPLEQQEALMFLTHFLGDIHQPLHVSFKDDLGGNTEVGIFMQYSRGDNGTSSLYNYHNVTTPLHAIWDEYLIDQRILLDFHNDYNEWKEYLLSTTLSLSYDSIRNITHCSTINSQGNPFSACSQQWATESGHYACTNAYVYSDGHTRIMTNFTLGYDYYLRNIPLVEERIIWGGVRLANVINNMFPDSVVTMATLARGVEMMREEESQNNGGGGGVGSIDGKSVVIGMVIVVGMLVIGGVVYCVMMARKEKRRMRGEEEEDEERTGSVNTKGGSFRRLG